MDKLIVPIPEIANHQLPDASLLQFYNDLENRIYWIDDEINTYSYDLIQYILKWNREDKDIPISERKPIRLIFCSPGGDLDVEEAIVSMINLSKTPIYGIAISCVASAASLIYLSCHKNMHYLMLIGFYIAAHVTLAVPMIRSWRPWRIMRCKLKNDGILSDAY